MSAGSSNGNRGSNWDSPKQSKRGGKAKEMRRTSNSHTSSRKNSGNPNGSIQSSHESDDMSISSDDEEPDPLRQNGKGPQKSPTTRTPANPLDVSRLSSFSQNLLKPGYLESRRSLLVDAPEIPLNDYCLQEFGRAVKANA